MYDSSIIALGSFDRSFGTKSERHAKVSKVKVSKVIARRVYVTEEIEIIWNYFIAPVNFTDERPRIS